jgi:hypothetical protein
MLINRYLSKAVLCVEGVQGMGGGGYSVLSAFKHINYSFLAPDSARGLSHSSACAKPGWAEQMEL